MGRSGRITAILFGEPLVGPPGRDRGNKILWVSRDSVQPLSDLGSERATADTVSRVVQGGPGPSGVELPAGCWRM